MTNSTIKPKKGQCIDCPKDSSEKYLISKRCESHYKVHRAKISAEKREGKETHIHCNSSSDKVIKKPKPIRKFSKKRQKENREYLIKRLQFLAQPGNQRCPVTGQRATEVHHKKGRVGDLLLDSNFWLAVSHEGHKKIEENPEWAKENGFSLKRI